MIPCPPFILEALNEHASDIAAGLASEGARGLVAASGGRLVSELQAKGGLCGGPFLQRQKIQLKSC